MFKAFEVQDRWSSELLKGMGEYTNDIEDYNDLKYDDIKRAYLGYDAIKFLAGILEDITDVFDLDDSSLESFACSSIVALRSRSQHHSILFGRNQDFSGLDKYDKDVSVQYISPEHGYKYVNIVPLGIPPFAITAMNEHGLTVALHTVFTETENKNGYSLLGISTRIMREAKNIEDACKILDQIYKKKGLISGWILHLADTSGSNGRVVAIDLGCRKYEVCPEGDDLSFCTNHYFTKELQNEELCLNYSYRRHSTARYEALVAQSQGMHKLSIEEIAELMRSRFDPEQGRDMTYSPWIVSTIDQTKSVIFLPDEKKFYVAKGKAPVSEGEFVEFTWDYGFNGSSNVPTDKLNERHFRKEKDGKGFSDIYINYPTFKKAYQIYTDSKLDKVYEGREGRYEAVLDLLHQCHTDNGYFSLAAGTLALKLNKPDRSQTYLKKALTMEISKHHQNFCNLLLSFAYDLSDKHAEAQSIRENLSSDMTVWPTLQDSAKSWLQNEFLEKDTKNLPFELKYFDTIRYPRCSKSRQQ